MFYDVRNMGHGACGVAPRSAVHAILVVLVIVYRSLARVHNQREIRWAICRSARGSLHRVRALARIGRFVQVYRK